VLGGAEIAAGLLVDLLAKAFPHAVTADHPGEPVRLVGLLENVPGLTAPERAIVPFPSRVPPLTAQRTMPAICAPQWQSCH
jgi:hypothetical protein